MAQQVSQKDARSFVDGIVSMLKTKSVRSGNTGSVRALLNKMTAKDLKEKKAYLQSSITLTQLEKQSIEKYLVKLVGHSVILEVSVRPHLIAGIRLQIGDWIVDTTIPNQLQKLETSLI